MHRHRQANDAGRAGIDLFDCRLEQDVGRLFGGWSLNVTDVVCACETTHMSHLHVSTDSRDTDLVAVDAGNRLVSPGCRSGGLEAT